MEKLPTRKVLCCFFIAFSLLSGTTSEEVEDEREFNYDVYSYKGPDHWGELRPEWSMCGHGAMQSPIDMSEERVRLASHLGELKRNYKPSNATLLNRGHDMSLKWSGDAGYVEINGTQYELKQSHWHSPSEHTINGRRYDLEFHMVHESKDQRTAVIAIMYNIGRSDHFLYEMNEHMEAIAHTGEEERVVGIVDPNHVRIGNGEYYRYIGSLTTPPCTENVVWTILSQVRTVSKKQVSMLRNMVHDDAEANARPLQPINQRPVKFYDHVQDDED